jgi:hypothetical protein
MPKGGHTRPEFDWGLFTGDAAGGQAYHPSRQAAPDRRERLGRAIRSLAAAHFKGDETAAAKRVAAHVGHIASYQTYKSPNTSERMRSNQRWIREAYYPIS